MSNAMIVLLVIVGLILITILIMISIYNNLVTLKNRFKNSFAQIDVQLNRRYDLIPNLVETAKAYMSHEQETLEKVIQARNQAHQVAKQLGGDAESGELVSKLASAEGNLSRSMTGFFALAENYPDLKANQTMQNLMEELSSTENKVAFSRQAYNDSVMEYNTATEVFPSNIIAGIFNFKKASSFTVENDEVRKAVQVKF
jgi:LemA protein